MAAAVRTAAFRVLKGSYHNIRAHDVGMYTRFQRTPSKNAESLGSGRMRGI